MPHDDIPNMFGRGITSDSRTPEIITPSDWWSNHCFSQYCREQNMDWSRHVASLVLVQRWFVWSKFIKFLAELLINTLQWKFDWSQQNSCVVPLNRCYHLLKKDCQFGNFAFSIYIMFPNPPNLSITVHQACNFLAEKTVYVITDLLNTLTCRHLYGPRWVLAFP